VCGYWDRQRDHAGSPTTFGIPLTLLAILTLLMLPTLPMLLILLNLLTLLILLTLPTYLPKQVYVPWLKRLFDEDVTNNKDVTMDGYVTGNCARMRVSLCAFVCVCVCVCVRVRLWVGVCASSFRFPFVFVRVCVPIFTVHATAGQGKFLEFYAGPMYERVER
jgi:hypothetical protein